METCVDTGAVKLALVFFYTMQPTNFSFYIFCVVVSSALLVNVCLCCVRFSFLGSVLS